MRKGAQLGLHPRAMALESATVVSEREVRRPGFGPSISVGWRMRRTMGRA